LQSTQGVQSMQGLKGTHGLKGMLDYKEEKGSNYINNLS